MLVFSHCVLDNGNYCSRQSIVYNGLAPSYCLSVLVLENEAACLFGWEHEFRQTEVRDENAARLFFFFDVTQKWHNKKNKSSFV